MEVLIPMEMANIIVDIGMTSGDLHYVIQRGVITVCYGNVSLFSGFQLEIWQPLQVLDMQELKTIYSTKCGVLI